MSDTPKSDAAIARFEGFTSEVRSRLEAGKRAYGDSSFETPLERMITEIQQELMDVTGWSFILFDRLEELRERLRAVSASAQLQPHSPPLQPTTSDTTH